MSIKIMKQHYRLYIVFITLILGMPVRGEAQFLKKLFKRHKRHQDTTAVSTIIKPVPVQTKKKSWPGYPPSHIKPEYRIDVLAPLYLDELPENANATANVHISEKASAGIEFYKGMKLAADSLTSLHYHLDLHIHDITDTIKNIDFLVSIKEFENSDLLIGFLQPHDIPNIARYAANNHINFASAFSPSDAGVVNNPYFTLLQPTLQTHCEKIKELLLSNQKGKKVILLHRNTSNLDETAYNYFTHDLKGIDVVNVVCDTNLNIKSVSSLFDSSQNNVVVVCVLDNTIAEKILKRLNESFPAYRFEVYGMPSWKSISSLKKHDVYLNVKVIITEPFYVNMSSKAARYIQKTYRKEFGGRPGEFVYRGYETLFWYANLLEKYGTIFNGKVSDVSSAQFSKFQVKANFDKEHEVIFNENKHLFIYRYINGKLKVE